MIERYRSHLPFFFRYLLIGGFVFIIDFKLYMALWNSYHILWLALAISQTVAFLIHFSLNRFLNFRSFDRSAREQFGTYLVVAAFCILVSQAVGYAWLAVFGAGTHSIKLAKCAAVGVNIPIGFIGHKKLTFGGGLGVLARRRSQRAA
jgi:putative flippase GtrA